VRIIKAAFIEENTKSGTQERKWLYTWKEVVKNAHWQNINDVRKTYPSADGGTVDSKRTVTVFNVCGNNHRLLTAIHYDKQRIYLLDLLTHAEYDKDEWKRNL
jgi:mRNA interferase HigB